MLSVNELEKNTTRAIVRRDLADEYSVTGLNLATNEEILINPIFMFPCVQSDFELDSEGRNLVLMHGHQIILVNSIDFDFLDSRR